MGLNIDTLKEQIEKENYLKVLNHCREPKSFKEIRLIKIRESQLFNILKELKVNEALLFADGKYYTSPEALSLMD